ncbi:hypothetical protein Taro_017735 [Colocasia esculenta]|uniref:Phototropic-responsive NPH3 family protein n=1 Tax=Colocasia esculenta TaxID=4460 RepID=A0A843UNZ2_COLES|nr:hypothetical protein [Colocasia esculenta]
MVSESALSSPLGSNRATSPHFPSSISKRIFSDVVGDITVEVDGQSFLLHKFPLVSRSGRVRKMVADSRDPELSRLELTDVPGGSEAFELAVKFCYGANFEINTSNMANLRCVAEYLEMTEDYREENLIVRTETFLTEVVMQSLEKCVEVLCACEKLLPVAEEVGIIGRCVDAIALNACREQLVSGLAQLECDATSDRVKIGYQDWWVEDLSLLRIDLYKQVIAAMRKTGVRSKSIGASLMHYAQSHLRDISKHNVWDSGMAAADEQRVIIETIVGLLGSEKTVPVPLTFLFGMLRMAVMVDAAHSCRHELERRIGFQLEMVTLDDLLIPSLQTGDSLFDVDTVHRILVNFLHRIEEEDDEEPFKCGYESEGTGSPSHDSMLKVGRLIDNYLAEIAPDPYLKLQKFVAIIELLPDYARVIDDGLYRAIDIYLKTHPSLTESECKKLCKLIDCQKLSQDASNHAAQNDRLPVQMVVRVLYFEQLRLKSAFSGSSGDGFFSQRMISSGIQSAAVSPRDNYASLRRENRELKLEISRMRVRLSELEKEQAFMKQDMKENKSGDHRRAFFTSLSRGLGRMGLFSPGNGQKDKFTRSHSSQGKKGRPQKHHS